MVADRCEMHDPAARRGDVVRRMASQWDAMTAQFARDAAG